MRIGHLFVGLAAFMCPVAAGAQATPAESRLVGAFAAICLEHLGDATAQRMTATAAPWNFAADGAPRENGLVPFRSASTRLGIGAAREVCTLTGEMDSSVTLASFQAAMTAAIGTDDGQVLAADSRYWLIADSRNVEQVLSLKISNQSGRNLATLWVQRRATVSPGQQ